MITLSLYFINNCISLLQDNAVYSASSSTDSKQSHERCGKILPVLQETEEIIMLGGPKHNSYINTKNRSNISNKRKSLNNVDSIIESVVKDTSGLQTGVNLINNSNITSPASKTVSNGPGRFFVSNTYAQTEPFPETAQKFKKVSLNSVISTFGSKDEKNNLGLLTVSTSPVQSLHTRLNDIMSTVIHQVTQECSVATVDLFDGFSLEKLLCPGCCKKLNGSKVVSTETPKYREATSACRAVAR